MSKKLLSVVCAGFMMLALAACNNSNNNAGGDAGNDAGDDSLYNAGTYSATVQGYNGDVTVEVTVSGDAITAVNVDASGETEALGGAAAETISADIVSSQSADVDTVAGATVTSEAVINGAKDCLEQAKN